MRNPTHIIESGIREVWNLASRKSKKEQEEIVAAKLDPLLLIKGAWGALCSWAELPDRLSGSPQMVAILKAGLDGIADASIKARAIGEIASICMDQNKPMAMKALAEQCGGLESVLDALYQEKNTEWRQSRSSSEEPGGLIAKAIWNGRVEMAIHLCSSARAAQDASECQKIEEAFVAHARKGKKPSNEDVAWASENNRLFNMERQLASNPWIALAIPAGCSGIAAKQKKALGEALAGASIGMDWKSQSAADAFCELALNGSKEAAKICVDRRLDPSFLLKRRGFRHESDAQEAFSSKASAKGILRPWLELSLGPEGYAAAREAWLENGARQLLRAGDFGFGFDARLPLGKLEELAGRKAQKLRLEVIEAAATNPRGDMGIVLECAKQFVGKISEIQGFEEELRPAFLGAQLAVSERAPKNKDAAAARELLESMASYLQPAEQAKPKKALRP